MAAGAPSSAVPAVLVALSEALAASPHMEFLLTWVHALCLRPDVAQKVMAPCPLLGMVAASGAAWLIVHCTVL